MSEDYLEDFEDEYESVSILEWMDTRPEDDAHAGVPKRIKVSWKDGTKSTYSLEEHGDSDE